jgi:hypothetical protein
MPKRVKQCGLALVGVGVAVGVIAPAVIAQGTDTDDFVQPVSTLVTTTSTKTNFVAQVGPATVTSTCTHASTSGRTPAHGLVMAVKAMSFNDGSGRRCTDSLGAHDGADIYTTSGVWHVTFLDAANDETTEPPAGPNSGDRLVVTVPIKGMTIVTSFDPTCVVTVAPTAPAHMLGAYNDANTLTITKAPVPITLTSTGTPGCPGGNKNETAKFTATYVLTPGVHDAS